jgi:hypothetical protein
MCFTKGILFTFCWMCFCFFMCFSLKCILLHFRTVFLLIPASGCVFAFVLKNVFHKLCVFCLTSLIGFYVFVPDTRRMFSLCFFRHYPDVFLQFSKNSLFMVSTFQKLKIHFALFSLKLFSLYRPKKLVLLRKEATIMSCKYKNSMNF